MNYTGQTSFAEMFEYYCTRNVTSAREHKEREMMRWAKDRIQQARREGWEQGKVECVRMVKGAAESQRLLLLSKPPCDLVLYSVAKDIAAMEYRGEK